MIEFDRPFKKFGTWVNGDVTENNVSAAIDPKKAGSFVEFDTNTNQVIQVRTGISLVSIGNAAQNLETEIVKPFGWSFE